MISDLACASIQLLPEKNLLVIAHGQWENGRFTELEKGIQNRWYIGLDDADANLPHIQVFLTERPVYHTLKTRDYLLVSYNEPDSDELSCISFFTNHAKDVGLETYTKLTEHIYHTLVAPPEPDAQI